MFDIGWSEMAVILLVALIVIGPRDLPRVARNVGRWVGKARALAREFQNQLEDMAREAELDKVKEEIERAGRTDLKQTVERTIDPKGELARAFDPSTGRTGGARAKDAPPADARPPAQDHAAAARVREAHPPQPSPEPRDQNSKALPERAPAEPT